MMNIPPAPSLPGWTHLRSGKVRDIYIPEGEDPDASSHLLLVASDRISAYDFVLPTLIPDKGIILTQMTRWWFDQLSDLVASHILSDVPVPKQVAGRALVVENLSMFPVECVVRGYLTGSGLHDYRATGQVCGHDLAEGLTESSRLDHPIFTPAAKAELGDHDENISFDEVTQLVGAKDAYRLRDASLDIYRHAQQIAADAGIILADTKFEFGMRPDCTLVLADEVLTPDSSRFWPRDQWVEGQVTPSFDKQYVRDFLTDPATGWDRHSGQQPPELPDHIVQATRERYMQAYRMLTGKDDLSSDR